MLRGNVKSGRLITIAILLAISSILAGCIRPVDPNATPSPTAGNVNVGATTPGVVIQPTLTNTPPPTVDPDGNQNIVLFNAVNQHYAVSANFNLNARAETFEVWQTQQNGTEAIIAFNYLNNSGLPCMGVAIYNMDAFGNPSVYTAGFQCSTDITNTSAGIAGQWLLVLANGLPINAVAVRVTNTPNATFLAVNNADGTLEQVSLNGSNYLSIRDFGKNVSNVNILDAGGNFINQILVVDNPQG